MANATKVITWNVSATDISPINCSSVDIFLSEDGGYTYPITLATNVPNNGSANIVVPNLNIAKARIKVKGSGNIFFDISNYDIKILKDSIPPNGISQINIGNEISIYPNPTSNLLHVKSINNNKLELMLTNILGQIIFQGNMINEATIDGTQFSKGVYFLNMIDQNTGGRAVKKVTFK